MPSRPKSCGTVIVGEMPKVGELEGRGGGVGGNVLRPKGFVGVVARSALQEGRGLFAI